MISRTFYSVLVVLAFYSVFSADRDNIEFKPDITPTSGALERFEKKFRNRRGQTER